VNKVFLLSPANCSGARARLALRPEAAFDAARRLRDGLPLGELFSFLSGLYFRGKLTYASAFSDPPDSFPGVLVITPCRGLVAPETEVTIEDVRLFSQRDICESDDVFTGPLMRDAVAIRQGMGHDADVILLGSIATGKYLRVLLGVFGERLKFPRDFVGRGDMSRGGLLLRCVAEGRELDYVPAQGAVLHGKRPPKLKPLRKEG
jgi:hypothetical protein